MQTATAENIAHETAVALGRTVQAKGRIPNTALFFATHALSGMPLDIYTMLIDALIKADLMKREEDDLVWIGPNVQKQN